LELVIDTLTGSRLGGMILGQGDLNERNSSQCLALGEEIEILLNSAGQAVTCPRLFLAFQRAHESGSQSLYLALLTPATAARNLNIWGGNEPRGKGSVLRRTTVNNFK
jgi:hypothetical protein